jgi:hypothetical protein
MNQGNVGQFVAQDGVWQDGGLIVHFPSESRWVAVLHAFQSQSFHTDDTTGHSLEVPAEKDDLPVAIVAALVNAEGDETSGETVTLINREGREAELDGWSLADKNKQRKKLTGVRLPPHGTAVVRVREDSPMSLGNKGGFITLLDADGIKIHGVSYTKQDADREGWLVLF